MNKAMLLKQYMMYSPKKKGRLPSDYQEVEYIESTGTQYINTLVIPTSKTSWEIEFEQTEKKSVWYFGVDTGWVTNGFGFNVHKPDTETNIYPLLYINSSTVSNFEKIEANQRYVVKYGNGLLRVNSTEYSVPSFTGTQTNPIYTNSINRNGTPDSIAQGTGKMYSLKFYEDNTIIRDFVPCYRKVDNEIGLYDIVNNQFYTNSGSGNFLMGRPLVYDTISGYQQVDYIESTGTQYIDTQVKANSNTNTELIVTLNKSIGGYLYGAQDSWANKMYAAYYNEGKAIAMGFGADWLPYNSSLDWNIVHSIKIDNKKLYLDNVQVQSSSETFDFGSYNLYIFAINDKGTPYTEESSSVKCHYFKIINNGTLIRNLIPMRKISTNELGLYDLVNGVFYTNQGSGNFLYGPPIVNIDGYKQLTHIESDGNAYLNTGLTWDDGYKLNTIISNAVTGDEAFCGVRTNSSDYTDGWNWKCELLSIGGGIWQIAYNQSWLSTTSNKPQLNTYYNCESYLGKGEQYLSVDGNKIISNTISQIDNDTIYNLMKKRKLFLFCRIGENPNLNVATNQFIGSCRYAKFTLNGVVVREYIPAERNDGVVGMYDLINNTFEASSGTDFIKGDYI